MVTVATPSSQRGIASFAATPFAAIAPPNPTATSTTIPNAWRSVKTANANGATHR